MFVQKWAILIYATSQNEPKQPKTRQNESKGDLKQAKTTQNDPKRSKATQNKHCAKNEVFY